MKKLLNAELSKSEIKSSLCAKKWLVRLCLKSPTYKYVVQCSDEKHSIVSQIFATLLREVACFVESLF